METIILQEVVHLPGSFNPILQSQIMDKDVKVEPVNHYGLNLCNRHGKVISNTPQVDGLFVLHQVLDWESTKYSDIAGSRLLALKETGHESQHNAEKRMLWNRRVARVGLKPLAILPRVVADAPMMTGKCDCESCIRCKLVWKPFTPTTSRATEPLQHLYSDEGGLLETAIGRGKYMLLCIDDATRHTDEYILKYKSEALEQFNEWKALRAKESGKQVRRFRTDGGG